MCDLFDPHEENAESHNSKPTIECYPQVTRVRGTAKFSGLHSVVVDGKEYNAKHILIATGGAPNKLGTAPLCSIKSLTPISELSLFLQSL